ncbi:MAG: T9SS type A sorting domain-containing protein [Bacteroidota bacterium]
MIIKTFTHQPVFKISICCLFLAMSTWLSAQTESEVLPSDSPYYTPPDLQQGADVMWDIQFEYDITTPSELGSLAGGVHIGSEFWVSVWNSDTLARFENDGTFIEKFSLIDIFNNGNQGVRGMTWDGTSIWMANNTSTIYQVDPTSKAILSQVNVTATADGIRFITYDETADAGNGGFWVGNFNTDILLIRLDGTLLSTIAAATHTLGGMYGAAVDNDSPGAPYLWVFHQAGAPSESLITQIDLVSGTPTGVARDVNIDFNSPGALAGGLFISKNWSPTGEMTLGGVNQSAPDVLFGYELNFVPSANIDVASANLTSPQTDCNLSAAEIVTFEITNVGAEPVTDIPLELLVNGTSVAVDTFFGTIFPGNNSSFTFTDPIDLSVPGNYIIGVRPNEPTDINNANDLTNWVVGSKEDGTTPVLEDFDAFPTETTIFTGLYNLGVIPFQVNTGGTLSNNTGPAADASGNGNYIYMEATGQNPGDNAILSSDCLTIPDGFSEASLQFDYHMYGAAIGNLIVEVVSGGMTTTALILAGQQQTLDTDPWIDTEVDLTPFIGQEIEIFITASIANNGQPAFLADVGLDNIAITACSPPDNIEGAVTQDIDAAGLGAIDLTITGGSEPFAFLWSNGAVEQNISNLVAGVYTVEISDANGCTFVEAFEVTDACTGFEAIGAITNVIGSELGAIDLTINGGNMPFTFMWSNGAMTQNVMDLESGDYFVSITDDLGCGLFEEFFVDEMTAVEDIAGLSRLDILPNPSSGQVQVFLELENSMEVQFSLFDIAGRELYFEATALTQERTYDLDLSAYSDGLYLARFVLDGQVISRRVILQR